MQQLEVLWKDLELCQMATAARVCFIWTHCLLKQSWGSASKEAKTTDTGRQLALSPRCLEPGETSV